MRLSLRRGIGLSILALAASTAFAAPPANAQSGQLVTIAARECPTYTDITANRARNNIMESLRDLGADTPYQGGEVVEATVEDRVQPNCRALENWQLTLGRGYKSRAVAGPWGSLSIVTDPFADRIVTRASTPLLDAQGKPTGTDLPGAVTIELSKEQADLAKKSSRLWLQGGTTTDPVLYQSSLGAYGFGALRCSSDDLNGDNVEWITFASGRSHVFCFAYYVSPPPTGGTIVVRKRTVGEPPGAEDFPFEGNISFDPGGGFKIASKPGQPGEKTFIRAETRPGEAPWKFAEQLPANWELEDLECSSASGGSGVAIDRPKRAVAVTLAAADKVTCTYTNRFRTPKGGLVLRKITRGGVGTFPFEVEPVDGGPQREAKATTTIEEVAADAEPPSLDLEPGRYRITERLPDPGGGKWELSAVDCDGEELSQSDQQTVTIRSGAATVCTYTNTFTPAGWIEVRLVTLGGTATAAYEVSPTGPADPSIAALTARTERPGEPARAVGDDLSAIPLRGYGIQQNSIGAGRWELIAVSCDGRPVPFDQGAVQVELTRQRPDAECTFVNRRSKPGPPGPPTPGPPPPGPPVPGPPVPNPPKTEGANLVVTKTAKRKRIELGDKIRYLVRVTNRGPSKAVDVSGAERLFTTDRGAQLLSIQTSRGRCFEVPLGRAFAPACSVGDLRPGESAEVRVVVRPTKAGVYRNIVAASSDTFDPNSKAAIDREKVIVEKAPAAAQEEFAPCRC